MSQSSFRHLAPALRVFHGATSLDQLKPEIQRLGRGRAVVFCGRSLSKAEAGLGMIERALGEVYAGAFTGVVEHSPLASVEAAVAEMRRFEADAIVVLGGGSAIVTARAAAILLAEGKGAAELSTSFEPGRPPRSPRLDAAKLPQFIVPTTPNTAYAKSGAAVSDNGKRLAMFDPKAAAHALFFHPALFASAPVKLARDASLDALVLAIEGLESARREPLADASLLHGARLIQRQLPVIDRDPQSVEARGELMLAALMIGQGTNFTGAGVATAIGHAAGPRFSLANGVVKAVVLPHTLRFNASATAGRLGDLAHVLGVSGEGSSEAVSQACANFFASIGLPGRLRDLGIPHEGLAQIAADSALDFFFTQNPRPVAEGELQVLLEAAW